MDALTGVIDGRLGSLDPRQAAQLRLDRLRVQAEAGALDIAKLQERLRSDFGEDSDAPVGDDGSVDFDRLQQFLSDQGSARLILVLTARLGDADTREDVAAGGNSVREKLVERNQLIARERLRDEFGGEADRFINADGGIDFEALREFLQQQRVNVDRLRSLELGPATIIDIET